MQKERYQSQINQNFGTVCHTEVCFTFLRLAAKLSEFQMMINLTKRHIFCAPLMVMIYHDHEAQKIISLNWFHQHFSRTNQLTFTSDVSKLSKTLWGLVKMYMCNRLLYYRIVVQIWYRKLNYIYVRYFIN